MTENISNSPSCTPNHVACHLGQNLCSKASALQIIRIESKDYYLPEGIYHVSDLKKMAKIPEQSRLVRIVGAEIIFLKNNECIALDGNEHFECSAGSGQAS